MKNPKYVSIGAITLSGLIFSFGIPYLQGNLNEVIDSQKIRYWNAERAYMYDLADTFYVDMKSDLKILRQVSVENRPELTDALD